MKTTSLTPNDPGDTGRHGSSPVHASDLHRDKLGAVVDSDRVPTNDPGYVSAMSILVSVL